MKMLNWLLIVGFTVAVADFAIAPAAQSVPPSSEPEMRARENLIHVLFNHNEFVTIR